MARMRILYVGLVASVVGCAPQIPSSASAIKSPVAASASAASSVDDLGAKDSAANGERKDPLEVRIDAAIEQVRSRDVMTDNGFWTIFHGVLGLGPGLSLLDQATGKRVNAVDYMFDGNPVRGMEFVPTDAGVDVLTVGISNVEQHVAQGHQDQFLAEMLQWGVKPSRKVHVNKKEFTLQDFINESKARARVNADQELSWAIIVVAEGHGTEHSWTNRHGEKIAFEDVVKYETEADIEFAACGGTHRLFGLTWAYHLHQAHCKAKGKTPSPVWADVKERLEKYKNLAKEWQAPDGGFSADYFRAKSHPPNPAARLGASGHILEWLAQYCTDEELREPWARNGAEAVARMILDLRASPIESGALYHATHGLITYRARVFGEARAKAVARSKKTS
ncbi:MAG TPA: hypothetical protein VNC50_18755 [Planctomycetia bacterium]|nr:hypothetical protein [Planctomycetia bacterium]